MPHKSDAVTSMKLSVVATVGEEHEAHIL